MRVVLYALTLGAFGITARAIAGEPPTIGVLLVFFTTYFATILAGVFVLRLRMFVDVVVRGPRGAKGVVLTFDDGPDPASTMRTLDLLDAANAKATFFVIGEKAEKHPEVVKAIVARGHEVGLHSYAHDRLFALRGPSRWRDDLERGARVLADLTGTRVRLFRPPIGHTVPHTERIVRELRMRVIGWDVSARDGIRANTDAVYRRVIKNARDGSIVLLHDASERGTHEPAGVAALESILAGLRAKGLAVVPLSEWLG